MKESTIDRQGAVPTNDQTAKVVEPGERALDFPAASVSSQFSSILRFPLAVAPVRADQLDAAPFEALAQRIAVVGFVGNDPQGLFSRPSASARHGDLFNGGLQQRHFRRTGRVQVVSERNTLAVDHHHPLRTLSAFGLSDAVAPFFAGANDPSAKVSAQSSWPFRSNSDRKARHRSSQTSCSSQSRSRRQQVLGEGCRAGRSFHRAPLRSTQRIPSNTRRLSTGLRPPFGEGLTFGNSGSIFAHCASVSSSRCLAMKRFSFPRQGLTYLHEN